VIDAPCFALLAGPNGAGKSTSAPILLADLPFFNADNAALLISPGNPALAAIEAGRQTLDRIDRAIEVGKSFAVETTLSGRGYLLRAAKAKRQGWKFGLIYVGVASPELAIQRVESRFQAGGHFVPAPDVRRRYARGLVNLREACLLVDHGAIYDNSASGNPLRLLLKVRNGRAEDVVNDIPAWAQSALRGILPGAR